MHLIHHGIGQGAGRLLGEQVHLRHLHALEQILAQAQHAFIGNARECILTGKLGQPTNEKKPDDEYGHQPQVERALGKAAVQQWLQQGGNQGLCR